MAFIFRHQPHIGHDKLSRKGAITAYEHHNIDEDVSCAHPASPHRLPALLNNTSSSGECRRVSPESPRARVADRERGFRTISSSDALSPLPRQLSKNSGQASASQAYVLEGRPTRPVRRARKFF